MRCVRSKLWNCRQNNIVRMMASMAFIDGAPLVAGRRVKMKASGESDKTGIVTQVKRMSIKGKLDDGELFECKTTDVSVEAFCRNRTRTLD